MQNPNASRLLVVLLTLMVSCGKNKNSSPEISSPGGEEVFLQTEPQGIYRVLLKPMNSQKAMGTADIRITGDNVNLRLTMLDTPANVTHLQYISTGDECPGAQADINTDGFIDGPEVLAHEEKILIPLDGDISTQSGGAAKFPRANGSGYYSYRKSTSLNLLLQDLRTPQIEDDVVKLGPNEGINLNHRHLIILGVAESTKLPETVGSIKELTKSASLPIACGKIMKILEE
ncbi:MAG TPA: hypothetical protein VNJ08_07910 [Bacteriovoracaceae bacterium]|nr:hypothetical protein [Bacteriovoracaceae bacterium]